MRSRPFFIGCVVLAGLTVAQSAWAYCTCGETWPAGAYEDSQVVFQGTVLSTKTVYVGLTRWQEARMSVERSWKGTGTNTLSIRSLIGKDECGVDFQAGESYLVYARSDAAGTLSTGKCQRTQLAELAKDDLQYLENRPATEPQPGEVFSDVPTDHPNFDAVTALFGAGIVKGYSDGTFRPERSVSRAEIVRILIDAAPGYRIQNDPAFGDPYDSGWLHFSDVEKGEWFVPFLRKAVSGKVVKGYRDGTFRPNNSVTFAEASKMVSIAFGLTRDWDGPVWYEQYVGALGDRRAIPPTVADVNTPLTRGELAEIIWRIRGDIRDRESKTADEVSLRSTCQTVNDPSATGIDMLRVRDTWLGWYNIERAKLGLKAYVGSAQLDRTAYDWSDAQADQGFSGHSRSGKQGTDYDYAAVRRWFTDQGVSFANVNGSTFTENIGWGPFRCSEDDCTDQLIAAMRQTFDFYQKEREQAYHPHWNAVVNPDFRMLGLGIALRDGKYYLTTHIATGIVSEPSPLCR